MLYVIRHGKTEWNALKKLQGQIDIPLNDEGREMAKEAALAYKEVHFDICFCSPMIRAKETADLILNGRNIPIVFDDRLKEISFGECEGYLDPYSHPECPVHSFFHDPVNYVPPKNAESFDDLFSRTGDFLKKIALPLVEKGKDVLIVGHGAMNSSIICQVQNIPLSKFWEAGIENCKLKHII